AGDDHKIVPARRAERKGSMEALVHHFKLDAEGFHGPAGDVYAPVGAPKGQFGVYLIADGGTKPYSAKRGARGGPHLRTTESMCRGYRLADTPGLLGAVEIGFGEVDR